jgi:hypothetical protein
MKKDILKGRPFQIAKESWEYAFADATEWMGSEWVGGGNHPEDVKSRCGKYDIKGLSSNGWKQWTSEASIKQTLQNKYSIDKAFSTGDSFSLWENTVQPWINKVSHDNYYITVFWRNTKTSDVRLIMFKIIQDDYEYSEENFTFQNEARMHVHNLYDPEQIKIYVLKSKKRMEMRINGKYFDNPNYHLSVLTGAFSNEPMLFA